VIEADSPDLRLELIIDDEPLVYCVGCWEREFGERAVSLSEAQTGRVDTAYDRSALDGRDI
jgi:hypothetical protein